MVALAEHLELSREQRARIHSDLWNAFQHAPQKEFPVVIVLNTTELHHTTLMSRAVLDTSLTPGPIGEETRRADDSCSAQLRVMEYLNPEISHLGPNYIESRISLLTLKNLAAMSSVTAILPFWETFSDLQP